MHLFKNIALCGTALLLLAACESKGKYAYETVEGDPLETKIYTLENGLKVFMTVNPEQPRIQTYIAVHAGGKDDPAESTGLAHYLEHLMFKGTHAYGTWNAELEAVELAKIDSLYEVYNHETDADRRKAIYHEIDSVSYEASRYAIPNEYDKLMAAIGADGTNAFTSDDVTCYTEDIPSNQLENWAKIQANRFQDMVIRLFHTELEAVYEEKNMSLVRDMDKALETVSASLYPNHPYGTQTVIGTQEHLKNPSLLNIRKYFQNYYRPNNVAICLSGDFNPDEAVAIIERHFGEWQPNENIERKPVEEQPEITEPIVKEVLGQEAENVWLAWRTPEAKHEDMPALELMSAMLYNGTAGLFDLDLVQPQKVLAAQGFHYTREQGSEFIAIAYPMPGQSLDEARDLLLGEVEKLKEGDFDERLLESVKTNYKLGLEKMLEENQSRAMQYVDAFVNGQQWADAVATTEKTLAVTKEDIIRMAQKYLGDNNYVCVNKRQGIDPNIVAIEKPEINPVMTNRDSTSLFLREIQESQVKPIEPRFVDFDKEISKNYLEADSSKLEMFSVKNTLNHLFQLSFVLPLGTNSDRMLESAIDYLDYLGTDSMSVEEVKRSFYSLGCSFSATASDNRLQFTLSGLSENMREAFCLMENVMQNLQPDAEALLNYQMATLQMREVNLSQQSFYQRMMSRLALYGEDYVRHHTLTNQEVMDLDPQALVDRIKVYYALSRTVFYYGPEATDDVMAFVGQEHDINRHPLPSDVSSVAREFQPTHENRVLFCHYAAPNANVFSFNNIGVSFSAEIEPARTLYNEYFGAGMNGVVFQEIRESRGLAYSCGARFLQPDFSFDPYGFYYTATTQVDKLAECLGTFQDIVENMPESEQAFQIAKQATLTRLRTTRTTRDAILWAYLDAVEHNIDYDLNSLLFKEIETLGLQELINLQKRYIKNQPHIYSVVADRNLVDFNVLKELGEIAEVNVLDFYESN